MSTHTAQQPLDATGGVDLGLPVRAHNPTDTDIVWQYDRQKHVIPAHGEAFVPYMAMVLWQGDPRAIDTPGGRLHEQYRHLQHEHLRVLYGVYEEMEGHNKWDDVPHRQVVCYPIDSDIPFNTVARDPEGNNMGETTSQVSQLKFLQDQMERQANQLRILQAKVAAEEHTQAALDAADLDPADLERQETDRRQVSPEEATGQPMVGPTPTRRTPKAKSQPVTRDGE